MHALRTIGAICSREIIKFVRDRSRLLGALVQPLGFWLLLGLGFQGMVQLPSGPAGPVGYVEFLLPGVIALVILFTAIFSTISVVEERKSGFLQSVLVAPTSRTALVLGNALGGTLLATGQAVLFLAVLPAIGLAFHALGLVVAVGICFLTGLAFTALGFTIAWRMETTRGFHAVMNLFLLPLWFLSGALFPADTTAPVLQTLIALNPVSYAVSGLRHGIYGLADAPATIASPGVCLLVSAGFAAFMVGLATFTVRRALYPSD